MPDRAGGSVSIPDAWSAEKRHRSEYREWNGIMKEITCERSNQGDEFIYK